MDTDGETTFGFDMEWPVVYRAGSESKTALCSAVSVPHRVLPLPHCMHVRYGSVTLS